NLARVAAADQRDPVPVNDRDSVSVRVRRADLAVAVTVNQARPNLADTLRFTVTLQNLGPDAASGVAVTDPLPAGLSPAASVPSQGTYVPATGAWSVGSLISGGAATLELSAVLDPARAGTTLVDAAWISA